MIRTKKRNVRAAVAFMRADGRGVYNICINLLFIVYCLLFIVCCLLFAVYGLLFAVYCLLLLTHNAACYGT